MSAAPSTSGDETHWTCLAPMNADHPCLATNDASDAACYNCGTTRHAAAPAAETTCAMVCWTGPFLTGKCVLPAGHIQVHQFAAPSPSAPMCEKPAECSRSGTCLYGCNRPSARSAPAQK